MTFPGKVLITACLIIAFSITRGTLTLLFFFFFFLLGEEFVDEILLDKLGPMLVK